MRYLRFLFLLTFLATAGCVPITTPSPSGTLPAAATVTPVAVAADPLANTRWQLASFDATDAETPVIAGTVLTLEFGGDGTVSGQGGCNGFGGTYRVEGDQLALQEIVSTLMACADNLATQQEQLYLEALSAVTQYRLAGDQLTLSNARGSDFLNFVRM